jgi:glycosyltransferase involved in cell wall biosynthesis
LEDGQGGISFALNGVSVMVMTTGNIRTRLQQQLSAFDPDVVLISTDPMQVLAYDMAVQQSVCSVYLARTAALLPFGPEATVLSSTKTECIRRIAATVAVSAHLADYVNKHSGIAAVHLPIQLLDDVTLPPLGAFDNTFVTMVNPCAIKGIDIFLRLAESFPDQLFAAIPSWGTTPNDMNRMARHANIRIMPPVDDIRDAFRVTRVILVPSLWAEARGRIVIESMLAGVPVLASDIGGIGEAVAGVPCLIPVSPITEYGTRVSGMMMREPLVPQQDIGPWRVTLSRLLMDPIHYDEVSRISREAALRYVSKLDIGPFEHFLEELSKKHREVAC